MTILQSLVALYDRLERRGEVIPKPGYAPVRIAFLLELDRDGSPLALIDRRDPSQRKPVAPALLMPEVSRTSDIKPAFLWDKTAYVFGVTGIEVEDGAGKRVQPGQGRRTLEEHAVFKSEHLSLLSASSDEGLTALRRFLDQWAPESWESCAFRNDDALDENIAFCLAGEHRRLDERPAARELIELRAEPTETSGPCLVSGLVAGLRANHPQFKGVAGAQSSGAALVSYNADAFESYDRERGANAPVSESAAFKYGAALNWLLDRNNARSFRLGETTVVFWADDKEANVGEESANAAEDSFWGEFGSSPDKDVDAEDASAVRGDMQNVKGLRKSPDLSKLQPETRLHILGLSPNSGRIAVRFWLVDTYGHLADNLSRYKRDIEIHPPGSNPQQKAYALLYETAVQRKAENIPPRLGGELARAILTGSRYPRTLFSSVIGRIRADKTVNAARAGMCKAVINRDHDEEVIPVALNSESDDGAYNLGRLFAVYEYAERSVAARNATIRDKYIGAASATPRRVFPILMRGYEHNASALAKGEGNQRGSGVKAAKTVAQILNRFGGEMPFPTSLPLEDQGRFFVGYYHQTAALYTKANGQDANGNDTEGTEQ